MSAAQEEKNREEAAAPRAPRHSIFAALRVLRLREFAIFWGGQAISLVGTWMQAFAQGYVVTSMTTSALALGLVNFCSSIPTLVLMPFGGVTADRLERRRILMVTRSWDPSCSSRCRPRAAWDGWRWLPARSS